jgi:hypothetical protein
MLRHNAAAAMLAAAMLVLAGCTGGVPGGADGGAGDAAMSDGSGTVTLYVSDQPGAMGDFEHLNVTVDSVAYHRVNASDDDGSAADGTDDDGSANGTDAEREAGDEAEEREDDGPSDELESEGWETYDINETTVDLTELQGENASVVGQQRLPNGTYDKVFLYVSDVNGTLADGSSTRVKLPSGKLQLEKRFTVGDNESVDFVFDATVVKAGKSGKYVLTPVVSESGTEVGIKEVAEDGESGLGARFVGSVDRGEAATVKVTRDGQPVAGATVEVGDEEYRTGGDGTVMFDVPADAEEVEIEVEYEDGEVELTRKFPGAEEGDDVEREDAERRNDDADGRNDGTDEDAADDGDERSDSGDAADDDGERSDGDDAADEEATTDG